MVPTTKEELRKMVSETTIEMYEEMTPQLIKLIDETKHNERIKLMNDREYELLCKWNSI